MISAVSRSRGSGSSVDGHDAMPSSRATARRQPRGALDGQVPHGVDDLAGEGGPTRRGFRGGHSECRTIESGDNNVITALDVNAFDEDRGP